MTFFSLPQFGVTGYSHDRTQGPAASIGCGAATVYRNYFAPVHGQNGQSKDNQINNLRDFSIAVGNKPEGRYFRVQGGYSMASTSQLQALQRELNAKSESEINALRGTMRVGVHDDVQVTSHSWGSTLLPDDQHMVTQVS
jgi:hypothetical protein